jgi:hypothetical protein
MNRHSNFSKAVALCNHGAALLQCGHYAEAGLLLLGAVDQYRKGCCVPTHFPKFPTTCNDRAGRKRWKSKKSSRENFLYTTPIFLFTEGPPHEYCDVQALVRLAIVFNFAICKHMTSLEGRKDKWAKRLSTSLKLYNWALSLEQEIESEVSPLGVVACLGIINNCAHIHKTLQNQEKADAMFQLLLSSLMVLREQGEVEDMSGLDGFVSATCHLILTVPEAAAAA